MTTLRDETQPTEPETRTAASRVAKVRRRL